MSTQITISPEIKLVVNTTPITGGSSGRIVFQTTGNTVGQSANLFWDDTNGTLQTTTTADNVVGLRLKSTTGQVKFRPYLNSSYGVLIESKNSADSALIPMSLSSSKLLLLDGNVIINSTSDSGFKLDVNGTARVVGNLTTSAGIQNFSNYQGYGQMQLFSASGFQMFNQTNNSRADFQYVTGSGLLLNINAQSLSGTLKALTLGANLIASANNDVLVGLDIQPTFTNGAFTGVKNLSIRVGNSYGPYSSALGHGVELNTNVGISGTLDVGGDSSVIWLWRSGARANGYNIGANYVSPNFSHLFFGAGGTKQMLLVGSNGNLILQNGGTFTDAGFRLDVNGTARVSSTTTIGTSAHPFASNLLTLISDQGSASFRIGGGNAVVCTSSISAVNLSSNDFVQCVRVLVGGAARINATITDWLSVTNWAQSSLGSGNVSANLATFGTTYATINASAQVEIASTTKGFLPPRMTNAQMVAITTPAEGLVVYDLTNKKLCCYDGATWQNLF